jgi:predicted ABC-type ATPase
VYLYLSSPDAAVSRVRERARGGGHAIPDDIVVRRYHRSLYNFFNLYRPLADSWFMLDNSSDSGPRPIAWRDAGGAVKFVMSGPWNQLREAYEASALDT